MVVRGRLEHLVNVSRGRIVLKLGVHAELDFRRVALCYRLSPATQL